ncbi:diacylglycerol kinase [Acanthamoeba castellanii str. Neff]|uniref:Diacylglycerol kinase n=1 Tax=Acanthamoeba castellanii (strain ATCC 30010 / Neff) TaxID=1257118 RepID=L8GUA0_ACACF|nr:diacylglycerol kinase [Acanthamoeba castellanii str. Neff]ELR16570.1 diacylglycerol kinase [Acanthamoeba castellanii str. Neff]
MFKSSKSSKGKSGEDDAQQSGEQHHEDPLLVFVNSKSGGRQGAALLPKFRALLPHDHVIDLLEDNQGPRPALEKFKELPNLKILACGGDGTGKWILETMDKMGLDPNPPVAVLPLGTGNDIARVLGWGGGYAGEKVPPILQEVRQSKINDLDRWQVQINTVDPQSGDTTETQEHCMNNYLSLGFADARVALDFHKKREGSPFLFATRGINKLWYAGLGAKAMLTDAISAPFFASATLDKILELSVDGIPVPLPEIEGLILLNLPSYAGGLNLWGTTKEDRFDVVSMNDGQLELIGIRSVFHFSQIGAGLATGVRIAQGKSVEITYKPDSPPLPCKIDGEPWLQELPATFNVTWVKRSQMLCRSESVASVSKPTKTGWMQKKGQTGPMSWRTRWFVLKDSTLYYYTTTQDTKAKGKIDLKFSAVTEDPAARTSFTISTPAREWYLYTDSEEDKQDWIGALMNHGSFLTQDMERVPENSQ